MFTSCSVTQNALSAAGTVEAESTQKKGYKLPRAPMTNSDLTRLINSDEVQSVVRPKKTVCLLPIQLEQMPHCGAFDICCSVPNTVVGCLLLTCLMLQVKRGRPLKKNPLRNLGALLKLNPYAKTARRQELLHQVCLCITSLLASLLMLRSVSAHSFTRSLLL